MNLLQKIKDDEILNKIKAVSNDEIYLVGGTVRDFVMGKTSTDRDIIVCNVEAKDFATDLAQKLNATFVPLDETNKIYRLVLEDKLNYIDITNPIENSLDADLKRRDLTINSIAVNLRTLETVDPNNGIEDINNKKIGMISEKNFTDDPLRLLRAFRFQASTGFEIKPEVKEVIKRHKSEINKPAKERIIYETVKLFGGEYAQDAIISMDECELLEEVMPFVKELKLVPPNSHHHLDLFHHSIETVKQIQQLYRTSNCEVKKHLESVDFGGLSRLAHLKFAGFMHDMGKYSTWKIIDGRHRFIKHDDEGAKLAEKYLKSMLFSNKQIKYITTMIKYHIYPSGVISAPDLNEKVMMRFVRKMDDNAIDVIIIAMADRLSAQGPEITLEMTENNINGLKKLLTFYLEKRSTLEPLPKLIDGNEVMQILNIKPSAKLGEIMDEIHEAQLNGDITTHEHAVSFLQKYKKY